MFIIIISTTFRITLLLVHLRWQETVSEMEGPALTHEYHRIPTQYQGHYCQEVFSNKCIVFQKSIVHLLFLLQVDISPKESLIRE